MTGCEICDILATKNDGADTVILETKYWRAVLDHDQRTLGKAFVTSLRHCDSVAKLTADEWTELHEIMRKLETSVAKLWQPTHFNWSCLMNNAAVEKQPTHVHWHFHPRYDQPVVCEGETFVDSEYFPPKTRTTHVVSHDIAESIATMVRKNY